MSSLTENSQSGGKRWQQGRNIYETSVISTEMIGGVPTGENTFIDLENSTTCGHRLFLLARFNSAVRLRFQWGKQHKQSVNNNSEQFNAQKC